MHYSNTPARAELVPEESVLVADGIAQPVIAVRFLDRDGRPVRAGVTGPFAIGPPYVTQQMVELQQKRQLAGLDRFQPTYRVEGDDGIAYVELQPTTESGEVVLDFAFQSEHELERNVRRQQLRAWLDADAARLGAGRLRRGHARLRDAVGQHGGGRRGGSRRRASSPTARSSFYAKGRVLGKWLLTLSYRSRSARRSRRATARRSSR